MSDLYDSKGWLKGWTELGDGGGFKFLDDGAVCIIAPQQAKHGMLCLGDVPSGISLSAENFRSILSMHSEFTKSKVE